MAEKCCETCRHYLGGDHDYCRVNNTTDDCIATEYEAWEPREEDDGCPKMPYIEKVVKGLEEIIALLKAQEPRVMRVDELQEFSTVWLEDVYMHDIIPAIYLEPLRGRLGFIQPGRGMIYLKADQCGKRWRPWTSRPTDAQRREAEWE